MTLVDHGVATDGPAPSKSLDSGSVPTSTLPQKRCGGPVQFQHEQQHHQHNSSSSKSPCVASGHPSPSHVLHSQSMPHFPTQRKTQLHLLIQNPLGTVVTMTDIQTCLHKDPAAVSCFDAMGRTPLFYAVQQYLVAPQTCIVDDVTVMRSTMSASTISENTSPTAMSVVEASLLPTPEVVTAATIKTANPTTVSLEMIHLLFHCFPGALTLADYCGICAISLLYESSSPLATAATATSTPFSSTKSTSVFLLSRFLQWDPTLVVSTPRRTFAGQTTLWQRLCQPYHDNRPPSLPFSLPTTASSTCLAWDKFVISLEAVHRLQFPQAYPRSGDSRHDNIFMITHDVRRPALHLALELQLSPAILLHFLARHPDHVAVPMMPASHYHLDQVQCVWPLFFFVSRSENATTERSKKVIEEMLRIFPRAVTDVAGKNREDTTILPYLFDGSGRRTEVPGQPATPSVLPPLLHTAVMAGFTWDHGIQLLLNADPMAIHTPITRDDDGDDNTHQRTSHPNLRLRWYPFVLAARATAATLVTTVDEAVVSSTVRPWVVRRSSSSSLSTNSSSTFSTKSAPIERSKHADLDTIFALLREGPCTQLRFLLE